MIGEYWLLLRRTTVPRVHWLVSRCLRIESEFYIEYPMWWVCEYKVHISYK